MYEMFKEIRDGITDEQEKRDYLKGQKRIEKMSASRNEKCNSATQMNMNESHDYEKANYRKIHAIGFIANQN